MSSSERKLGAVEPIVEIWCASQRVAASAAASATSDVQLSPEQISALRNSIGKFVSGFSPSDVHEDVYGFSLSTLEIELGFVLKTSTGSVLKLMLNAGAEASIKAKVVWKKVEKQK